MKPTVQEAALRHAFPETDVYTSITAPQLDHYAGDDQGDRQPMPEAVLIPRPVLGSVIATATPVIPVVPFTRTIKLWSQGKDVEGAKRAIWAANGLQVSDSFTQVFGPLAVAQLKTFQNKHGLTADGQLGPATLAKLGRYFDRYAFLLYEGYPPGGTKAQQQRNAIVAYALWGYNNRVQIHYAQFRPMGHLQALELLPVSEDCSTFSTKAYKFAGATDPNGMQPPYNGSGNTGTQRAHGRLVSLAQALPGDLVHYDGPEHVAIYIGAGRVVSHGSELGPLLLDATYRHVAQVRSYL